MAMPFMRRISFKALAMSLMLDAFGRLVQQQHLGVGDQRACDGQLLLLAARQVAALAAAHVEQHREQRIDLVGHAQAGRTLQPGLDVLLDRQRRKDHAALRHIGDALGHAAKALVPGDVLSCDLDAAALERQDAHQTLEQRGLAHAIAAHDGHGLVGLRRERDAVQRLALAIGGVDVVDIQKDVAHQSSPRTSRKPVGRAQRWPDWLPIPLPPLCSRRGAQWQGRRASIARFNN
jgi:hypothetical protein